MKKIKIKIIKSLKKMPKRNLIIIGIVGLILIALTFYLKGEITSFVLGPELPLPQRAAFYFTPSSGEATPGESFNVDLMLNTDGLNVSAISTYISYDSQKIQVQNIDRTSSVFGYEVESSIDNVNGIVKITAGQPGDGVSNDTDDGFTGSNGKVATLSLKILPTATGNASLDFVRKLADVPGVTNCKVKDSQGTDVFVCVSRMVIDDGLGTDSLATVNNGSYIIKPSQAVNFNLNITVQGNGKGVVTSNPAGINCGVKCSQSYKDGSSVGLIAEPDNTSIFESWGGDVDCSDGVITMDKDKACTVTFGVKPETPPNTYTLRIIKTGEGTVSSELAGIDCGTDCSESYQSGTAVTLRAEPNTGWRLIGWHGAPDCQDGALTMDGDKTCTVQFGPIESTPPKNNLIKVKLSLEGRKILASLVKIEIKSRLNEELIKTYTDVDVAEDGSIEIDASDLGEDTYHIKLVVPGYLTHTLASVTLPDNLVTFTPPKFIAGNLYDKDNVINGFDWAVMNRKWGSADSLADINQDGVVNGVDWGYMNRNWGKNGN